VGLDWVHLVCRPQTGLLYQPQKINDDDDDDDDEECEQLVEWELAGKLKYSEKTCPSATLSTTNPTWADLGLNLGRRGWKPATNSLSYGTAFETVTNTMEQSSLRS
jgi:hypothetical protein